MPQIALYRKYRPSKWSEVLGQDHIVESLKGSAQKGDIAHAYLFAGSRGIGKTSVARILASAINVEAEDLYEIDAASNRGIDDIRELRDAVNTLPLASPYKCYIIDEVHMLTREAFNALLKTLEEPPSHCVFILATTEMHKLPDTVVSRCQVHHFKKPSNNVLKEALKNIAKKEGHKLDPAGAELVTLVAEGSFRDAVGLLQKVLATAGENIEVEQIEKILGTPKSSMLAEALKAIARKDCGKILETINQTSNMSIDMALFAKMLVRHLRYVLLLRFARDMEEYIKESVSEEEFKTLKDLSLDSTNSINSHTLALYLEALEQIPRAGIPTLPLELATVKLFGELI